MMTDDERWMELAVREAQVAADENEVPVGAIIVHEGVIVARDHNRREKLQDPTAHAEILALTAAANAMGSWRLDQCHIYVTLEPCLMCAGAIVQARMARLVFGAFDPKAGACGSLYHVTRDTRLNHQVDTVGGVWADVCGGLLTEFFATQRALGKK